MFQHHSRAHVNNVCDLLIPKPGSNVVSKNGRSTCLYRTCIQESNRVSTRCKSYNCYQIILLNYNLTTVINK